MLPKALEAAMRSKGVSARELGRQIDVSHTTILRALEGKHIDLDTLTKLSDWLNVRPSELLDLATPDGLADKVVLLCAMSPGFKEIIEKAVEAVEAGKAKPEIIADIVAYANYKLNLSS